MVMQHENHFLRLRRRLWLSEFRTYVRRIAEWIADHPDHDPLFICRHYGMLEDLTEEQVRDFIASSDIQLLVRRIRREKLIRESRELPRPRGRIRTIPEYMQRLSPYDYDETEYGPDWSKPEKIQRQLKRWGTNAHIGWVIGKAFELTRLKREHPQRLEAWAEPGIRAHP
jgi:hypothetical protein